MTTSPNLHIAWSRLFVRGLVGAGVRHVVVSPGSRSTPLALAFAEEPALVKHVVIDERSAAFAALGLARQTEQPPVLLCTSGTAGAHYFPAILEANEAHVPLVVVTADRPWEAYDCASSQTMDQVKLFSSHVRHYAELGLPDEATSALRGVGRIAAQAVSRSRGPVPGPVHVNARFRKPLEPVGEIREEAWPDEVRTLLAAPAPQVVLAEAGVDPRAVSLIVEAVTNAPAGILALGPMAASEAAARDVVARFAARTGYALFAEATSQHRFGSAAETAVPRFDALLRVPRFRERAPDLFLEIGRPLVSSSYLAYRERHASTRGIRLAPFGWNDPFGTADLVVGPVAPLLEAVLERLPSRAPTSFLAALREADQIARACVSAELAAEPFTEGQVAHTVIAALPEGTTLLVGNSSPVRDLDLYNDHTSRSLRILHQRGVAGIDGLVAGAVGAMWGSVEHAPVVALLGDVSFVHDLGSLVLARTATGPLVLVVIDNGGGRIFGELPIAARPELREPFERYFTTPPVLDFVAIGRSFGFVVEAVASSGELTRALRQALARATTTILVANVAAPEPSPRHVLAETIGRALGGAVS